jgi:hypothetical protein
MSKIDPSKLTLVGSVNHITEGEITQKVVNLVIDRHESLEGTYHQTPAGRAMLQAIKNATKEMSRREREGLL